VSVTGAPPWLEAPSSWRRLRIKYLGLFFGGGTPSKENLAYWSGDLPWVSPKDMKQSVVSDAEDHITRAALRESASRLVPEGSMLIVVRSGILQHTIPVAVNSREVALNQDMKAFVPINGFSAHFLRYLLRGWQDSLLLAWRKVGATVESLDFDLLRNTDIAFPNRVAQDAIVTFLDRKTAAIDALIAKKERLIALLQEKRQALITQAVTKGLDPSVPMKESGVEWIGRVPSHWRRTRLGYLSMIGNGSTPSREEPSYWAEKGFPWLNSAKVNDETVPQADRFVTPRAMQECHLPRVNPGTVLMAITGEGQTRGRAAVLTFEATVSQHIAYIAPSAQIIPRFLLRQLQARYLWLRQESSGGGSTKGALTCEFLRTVPITLPPIAEQDAIVARMDRVLAHQGHVVDLLSGSVEKLREYRQALITAAVTGKIDVSTEAA